MMKPNEPLKPAPIWLHTSGAGWSNKLGGASFTHVPSAYENGFEAGAFALGELVHDLLAAGRLEELVALASSYKSGNAHPVSGWKHEPARK